MEGGNPTTPFRSGHFCCCPILWASSLFTPTRLALPLPAVQEQWSAPGLCVHVQSSYNTLGYWTWNWDWQWVLGLQKIQRLANSLRWKTRSQADQRNISAAERGMKNFSYRTEFDCEDVLATLQEIGSWGCEIMQPLQEVKKPNSWSSAVVSGKQVLGIMVRVFFFFWRGWRWCLSCQEFTLLCEQDLSLKWGNDHFENHDHVCVDKPRVTTSSHPVLTGVSVYCVPVLSQFELCDFWRRVVIARDLFQTLNKAGNCLQKEWNLKCSCGQLDLSPPYRRDNS